MPTFLRFAKNRSYTVLIKKMSVRLYTVWQKGVGKKSRIYQSWLILTYRTRQTKLAPSFTEMEYQRFAHRAPCTAKSRQRSKIYFHLTSLQWNYCTRRFKYQKNEKKVLKIILKTIFTWISPMKCPRRFGGACGTAGKPLKYA